MSLGKLLTAGKCLVGGPEATSRYQMNKQMRLPKFVSPRNPFATEGKTEVAPAQSLKPAQDRPAAEGTAVRPARKELSNRAALVARLVVAMQRTGEWLGKANPFSRFPKSARPKKSAIPRFPKPPVQSELHLDKVQVVRNDLSDADLEVVAVVAPVAPNGVKSGLATAGQCETAGSAWGRLTTRIFSSTQM
jgi:hypothetical protein